jgi:hypothetical protein
MTKQAGLPFLTRLFGIQTFLGSDQRWARLKPGAWGSEPKERT